MLRGHERGCSVSRYDDEAAMALKNCHRKNRAGIGFFCGFVSTDGFNYGCAGRDFYNANSITVGKQVDEVDKRFYTWKKCVQCALKSFNIQLDDVSYDYDLLGDSCGTNLNHLSNSVKLYLRKLG